MTEHDPFERLALPEEPLELVLDRAVGSFGLGSYQEHEVIPIGYEDFNVRVQTTNGEFFIKIFSKVRTDVDIERFNTMMQAVISGGVRHPRMYPNRQGGLVWNDPESELSFVAMDYVKGKTFYDKHRTPTDDELSKIMEQAVLINKVEHKPIFMYDSWAIPNLARVYEPVRGYIPQQQQNQIDTILADLRKINENSLPHCFVHGDIIKSNVILGDDNEIYIVDYSVANWYPRIQELAVIVGGLLSDTDASKNFGQILERVTTAYRTAGGSLNQRELRALPAYARAAYAAEYVGAIREKFVNNVQTAETEYWLAIGLAGLKRAGQSS